MAEINIEQLHFRIEENIREQGFASFINNFSARFPFDNLTIEEMQRMTKDEVLQLGGYNLRAGSVRNNELDVSHSQIEYYIDRNADPKIMDDLKNSVLFMQQTDRQFFASIDEVIED